MQNIRIATSFEINICESICSPILRRDAELTLEVEWRNGTHVAFSRVRLYKFDPEDKGMDQILHGIRSGQFLYSDHWYVDGETSFNHDEPAEMIIEDWAGVLKWFGPGFNPAGDLPDNQKRLTDGQQALPPADR